MVFVFERLKKIFLLEKHMVKYVFSPYKVTNTSFHV